MPTYDYKCKSCEHIFEEFHKVNEKPKVKCPICGGKAEKILTPPAGFILKGSGFYQTDYKNKEKPKKEKAESKSSDKPKSEDKKDQKSVPKEK